MICCRARVSPHRASFKWQSQISNQDSTSFLARSGTSPWTGTACRSPTGEGPLPGAARTQRSEDEGLTIEKRIYHTCLKWSASYCLCKKHAHMIHLELPEYNTTTRTHTHTHSLQHGIGVVLGRAHEESRARRGHRARAAFRDCECQGHPSPSHDIF